MSCSSELIKLEEEAVGISNLQADLKHSWQPRLGDWHLKWGQTCGTESLTYGIWCYLQVGSVRSEFNCGTPSWCCRAGWCGNTLPHYLVSEVLWVWLCENEGGTQKEEWVLPTVMVMCQVHVCCGFQPRIVTSGSPRGWRPVLLSVTLQGDLRVSSYAKQLLCG